MQLMTTSIWLSQGLSGLDTPVQSQETEGESLVGWRFLEGKKYTAKECRLGKLDAAADGGRSGRALVWRRQWAHIDTRLTCPQLLFTDADITAWKDES